MQKLFAPASLVEPLLEKYAMLIAAAGSTDEICALLSQFRAEKERVGQRMELLYFSRTPELTVTCHGPIVTISGPRIPDDYFQTLAVIPQP